MVLSRNMIMDMLKSDEEKKDHMSLYDSSKLSPLGMTLEMDRDKGMYLYSIPMSSLIGADVDKSLISGYRWEYSKDNDALVFFIA